jgi:KRAB domain-containing zinc finger protein
MFTFQARECITSIELAFDCQTEDEDIKIEPDETINAMDVSSESSHKCEVIINDKPCEKPPKWKKRKKVHVAMMPGDPIALVYAETHIEHAVLPTNDTQSNNQNAKGQTKSKDVQCYFCSEIVLRVEVKEHMLKGHGRFCGQKFGPLRPFKCHNCNESLVRELKDTPSHVCFINTKAKKTGEPHTCEICASKFARLRNLTRHMTSVHCDDRPFECLQCDYKAKIYLDLDKHIRRVHNKEKNMVCGTCGDKFFDGSDLSGHEKNMHQLKPLIIEWPCDMCGKILETKRSLGAHKRIHVSDDVKQTAKDKIPCETCGQMFANKYLLTYHIEWDHPTQDAIDQIECNCHNCNLAFPSATVLNVHLGKCLDDSKNFPCEICIKIGNSDAAGGNIDYKWKSGIALKKHVSEAHHLIRLVCNICGLVLKTKSKALLEQHIQSSHQGLKNWTCELCGKTYATKSALETHVGITHENKRFACNQCGKVVKSVSTLRSHVASVHDKNIEYQCQMCEHKTFSKCALRVHIRGLHTKSLPLHPCMICNKDYYKRKRLAEHMIKHHPRTNM